MRYYRFIISAIFSKTFTQAYLNFERAKAELKPNQSLALFGHEGQTLQEVTLGPFLNDRGYDTLKDLLSLVRKKKGDSIHNKYLCHLLALFLLFFNESETYDILSTML